MEMMQADNWKGDFIENEVLDSRMQKFDKAFEDAKMDEKVKTHQ